MNRLFYCNHKTDGGFLITAEDHRHAIKVLRLKLNDPIDIIDGSGSLFHCKIHEISKKSLTATIQSKSVKPALPYRLGIAISTLKNPSRFEWFLEKAVEIGITDIYPLNSKRTEKPTLKYDRSRKIIHSAMKQSLNIHEPQLHEIIHIEDLISLTDYNSKFVAYINDHVTTSLSQSDPDKNVLIVIGPEGGFTTDEAEFMISSGFNPVSLGQSRLRTETAGVASCQIIKTLFELRKNES
ncbi:MAG: 16S rRNA (uracil(1498)-N(3))-methyltransferase [Saprospiraceae bacterium]|nr:16S rRNA (uracil(1498)-N(3))-methyltransferase [Saprospiraceae bacterium]